MLDSDHDTLPEDSVPDLRCVGDRLKSFDKFLGHSSRDLDDIVLAKHDQSLLDFNESCMLTVNKSNAVSHLPVKHDGILEKILAKPILPIPPTAKETSSSIRKATNQTRVDSEQKQTHSINNTLFAIGEGPEEKKGMQDMRGRRSGSRDKKDQCAHKSKSPHSTTRSQRKQKETTMSEHGTIKVLRTDQETQNVPNVASSPSLIEEVAHQQHQPTTDRVDPLSRSLHNEGCTSRNAASNKLHSRHGLYKSMGRRSEHGDRPRTTVKSKLQDPLTSRSAHVPMSRSKLRMALERKSSSSTLTQSSELNDGEEDGRGKSRSPSCPRPRPVRRSQTTSSRGEENSSSRDGHDEKKIQSHRSPRKPSSEILRSRSTPRTSPPSRRTKKPSSSTHLVVDAERPLNRRSRSSEDIVDQTSASTRDLRKSTSRRRLKSRGSQGDLSEQSRKDSLKRLEGLQSFFGTRGGSGIIPPAAPVKRLTSSGELSSNSSHHHSTPLSKGTKPAITEKTMKHLMLDLRRETSRNLIQKFKSTRDLQGGIMDDTLP